ncbi:MAG: hypothetical protein R3D53_13475 [Paracoccaceae bacterium]
MPFLKIDKGLEAEANGCQLMKPIPGPDALLARGGGGIFGTKERSVISAAGMPKDQGRRGAAVRAGRAGSLAHGLIPIIEPEVTISIADKAEAEAILRDEILARLDALPGRPAGHAEADPADAANFYKPVDHPRDEGRGAVGRLQPRRGERASLAQNTGIIACSAVP